MPRVGLYERQISPTPLPGARLTAAETPDSEGAGLDDARAQSDEALAGVGAGIARAGDALGELQTKQKTEAVDQANDVALLAASNQLDAGVNQMLYDPTNGALTLKGKDAMGLPESTADSYQQLSSQIASGLTNDKQRVAFAKLSAQHEQNLDLTIRRHVFAETQAYETDELQSFVKNKSDNAIKNAADPRMVFEQLGAAVTAIKASAPRLGLGPEETQQKIDATTTATHVGVIDTLLAQNNPTAAQVYYEETKDQITGGASEKIEKAIAEGALRGNAQKTADDILAKGGAASDQRDAVKAITDPQLRDAVEERIEHAQAVQDKADRDQEVASLNDAYDTIDRTHSIDAIPPAQWLALGVHHPALREYADRVTRGVPVETDPATYYGLMRQAGTAPDDFANVNLLASKSNLDTADFKQLSDLQLSIQRGDREAAQRTLAPFTLNESMVQDGLTSYGLDPKPKAGTPAYAAKATLQSMLRDAVTTKESLTGKKLDDVQIQQELDRILTTSKTTPGSWWGLVPFTGTKVFDKTTRITDVPLTEQSLIKEALRHAGQPVDDATVLGIYLAQQAKSK